MRLVRLALSLLLLVVALPYPLAAQASDAFALSAPVDTATPRSTIRGFLAAGGNLAGLIVAVNDAGERDQAQQRQRPVEELAADYTGQAATALDLSSVPPNVLDRARLERVLRLYEVLRRVDPQVLAQAPDDSRRASWIVPGTPVKLVRLTSGDRKGEFVFAGSTVDNVDKLYLRALARPPLWGPAQDSLAIVLGNLGQVRPGPLQPVVDRLPAPLQIEVSGNALWQWFGLVLTLAAASTVAVASFLLARRFRLGGAFGELVVSGLPVIVMRAAAFMAMHAISVLYLSEAADWVLRSVLLSLAYTAWVYWLVVLTAWLSRHVPAYFYPNQSIKAAVARLSLRFIGVVATGVVVARGLELIGVPLVGIVAGLGVGGLALALAAQPTAENLIAGVILFVDQPARVGDECEFSGYRGIVEEIGIRSTSIRLSDGTLLTLTNSQFCNMMIRNLGVGHHQFSLDLPLAANTEAARLHRFIEECRAMLLGDAETVPDTARVDIETISAAGIFVKISGRFMAHVADPGAAWQQRQIAILETAQRHDLQLATVG